MTSSEKREKGKREKGKTREGKGSVEKVAKITAVAAGVLRTLRGSMSIF